MSNPPSASPGPATGPLPEAAEHAAPVAEAGDEGLGIELPARPYPGLRPFELAEWPIFFGREAAVDAVVERLVASPSRMVFVHGDSGCGKSSLVRAGLFAQLEQGRAGPGWRTAVALPGDSPLWHVALALAELATPPTTTTAATSATPGPPTEHGEPPARAQSQIEERALTWRRALDFGAQAPAALAELYARSPRAGQPACLLIDQFEELFDHARRMGSAEADALTAVLTAWQAAPPKHLYLAITMRSEYLGACARHGRFAEAVNATQYLLPRMMHGDMLRAVREPAHLYEGEVSRELAELLLADAERSHNRGQDLLPLVQHALMRLHGRLGVAPGHPWRLGAEHFPAGSSCAGLLSEHADEVRARFEAKHPEAPRLVEDVMRALTDVNAEGLPVRRPQALARLAAVTGAPVQTLGELVDEFRADGISFLRPAPAVKLEPGTRIDIGHEALIRCWRALAEPKDGWLAREFRNGLVWRALLVQAESYERDNEAVLNPTTTDERELWMKRRTAAWAERHGGGWPRVHALLRGSVHKRDADRERARVARRWKWVLSALLGLAVLVSLGLYGWQRNRDAEIQRANFLASRAQQEQKQLIEAQLQALEAELENRTRELGSLRDELKKLQAAATGNASRADLSERIGVAANTLERQINQLKTDAAPATAPANAPRLYVHIAEESQRAPLQLAWKQLANKSIQGERVIAPGIELVRNPPARAVLRCFDATECAKEAPLMRDAVNAVLRTPQVVVEDLSKRYGNSPNIRPRHYELWLPEGPVVPR